MGFSHEATTHHSGYSRTGAKSLSTRKTGTTMPALSRSACTWDISPRCFLRGISKRRCSFTIRPTRRRDDDEAQGTDPVRILRDRARRTDSADHGQPRNQGRGARVPAFSDRRSSDGRRSRHSRRTFEEVIMPHSNRARAPSKKLPQSRRHNLRIAHGSENPHGVILAFSSRWKTTH